ncbi:helix-turn-helix domain-containing protein [Priestia megaterium]|uniref:helix-turn-helix domain-containing protein n=1 Tax=Priestia megaterium TaxID=1404 RepID=UPI001A93BEDF|nr:helix-turn-helix transcriptional regulator [Priestia megaterium]QSX18461.1 helix-turn-helix transcriptional regulator [Priestia megaterium]
MDKQVDKQLIRVIKAVNNMPQSQFSEIVNISRSLLEKIEAGNMPITENTALKIRSAFDLDAEKTDHVKKTIDLLTLDKKNVSNSEN